MLAALEEKLKTHASNRAVVGASATLSYTQLDVLSAGCAAVLQEQIGNEFAPIAVLMTHDAPLLAALVGVLRSGGFYLALNPTNPIERLQEICAEVRPSAIITDAEHLQITRGLGQPRVFLFDELSAHSPSFSRSTPTPTSPCALFYTSGSLQKPKPIVYTHAATFHNVTNYAHSLGICSDDRLTLLSPCSAAASVSGLFGALLNGASVHPFDPMREGLRAIGKWIEREQLTIYHSVPSLFRRVVQALGSDEVLRSVRSVKLGGEPLFASDVELFRRHFPDDAILINGLGMTEANGNVCHFRVTPQSELDGTVVPVGRALDGIELTLCDRDEREVGEITIRGKFIAPGFWTGAAVQFYGLEPDGWFRTGDIGRKTEDGLLEHLGRKDDQLKRRGQWVNLNEVEAALLKFPGVRGAAAIPVAHAGHEKRIAAFVAWKGTPIAERKVRQILAGKLPTHALPGYLFYEPTLPVLPNGKINRRMLSDQAERSLQKVPSVERHTVDPVVGQLLRIWEQVLGTNDILTKEDFVTLGGDSLAAITVMAAVEKFFRVRLPASTLVDASTIEKLAEVIRKSSRKADRFRLIAHRLTGQKPALFYVPGAGSEGFELEALATYLAADQPVVAFQPRGLDRRSRYHSSVTKMARAYLADMRIHQPRGPYYLCGSSFGGVVAFEMARRLAAAGEEVAFLGLFDSYGGNYPKARIAIPEPAARISLLEIDVALRFSLFARDYESRILCARKLCGIARRRYALRPFGGRIDLFRTDDQPPAEVYETDPFLGWSGMAAQGITLHELPGRHGDYMREPHVAVLAGKLTACLARAQIASDPAKD